jgi:hypothetical protein
MKQQLNDSQLKDMQLTSLTEDEAKKVDGGLGGGIFTWKALLKKIKSARQKAQSQDVGFEGPPTTDP